MMRLSFVLSCSWQQKWEMGFMYQIPTVRVVHILSADTSNPRGPAAKQVTVCFKSLPDAPFSKSQMKNRGGGGAGLPRETNINMMLKQSVPLTVYWYKQQHLHAGNLSNPWQQTWTPLLQITVTSKYSGTIILCRCCQTCTTHSS